MGADKNDKEEAAKKLLQFFLKEGLIKHQVERGAAIKIISQGFGSLTERQKGVYEDYILPILVNGYIECSCCQASMSDLPLLERCKFFNSGLCPRCGNKILKKNADK